MVKNRGGCVYGRSIIIVMKPFLLPPFPKFLSNSGFFGRLRVQHLFDGTMVTCDTLCSVCGALVLHEGMTKI